MATRAQRETQRVKRRLELWHGAHPEDWIRWLPTLNALLNTASAVFLVRGYRFIRRREIESHRRSMLTAFGIGLAFLASYLTYHYFAGATPFGHEGERVRTLYFAVLISHTVLAGISAPMIVWTLVRAVRGRFELHVKLARWTLPIWLYVSVTGVVVYLMLYHVPGAAG